MHKNMSLCAIRFATVSTQSRTACCEAKISRAMADSDKESKWLKEKREGKLLHTFKKKASFKDYKRQKFG